MLNWKVRKEWGGERNPRNSKTANKRRQASDRTNDLQ